MLKLIIQYAFLNHTRHPESNHLLCQEASLILSIPEGFTWVFSLHTQTEADDKLGRVCFCWSHGPLCHVTASCACRGFLSAALQSLTRLLVLECCSWTRTMLELYILDISVCMLVSVSQNDPLASVTARKCSTEISSLKIFDRNSLNWIWRHTN